MRSLAWPCRATHLIGRLLAVLQELHTAQQAEGARGVPAISSTFCSGLQGVSDARHARKLLQGVGEGVQYIVGLRATSNYCLTCCVAA